MNNLPKVVTQRCPKQDLKLRPTDRKPKCLTRYTTAPPCSVSCIFSALRLVLVLMDCMISCQVTTPQSGCGTSRLRRASRSSPSIGRSLRSRLTTLLSTRRSRCLLAPEPMPSRKSTSNLQRFTQSDAASLIVDTINLEYNDH